MGGCGADLDVFNRSAAHIAVLSNSSKYIDALWASGSAVDESGPWNMSALHIACSRGHSSIINTLVAAGADTEKPDMWGRSAKDLCCTRYGEDGTGALGISACKNIRGQALHRVSTRLRRVVMPTLGWKHFASEHLPASHMVDVGGHLHVYCDIDVVNSSISKSEFERDYVSLGKPVLISNLTGGWKAVRTWSRERVKNAEPTVNLSVSDVPYGNLYGRITRQMSLRDFFESVMDVSGESGAPGGLPYIFDGLASSKLKTLLADTTTPEILEDFVTRGVQFALGPAASGSPSHFHGMAWNALVHGGKFWWLTEPSSASFSSVPVSVTSPKGSAGCWQGEGDVLVVPESYGHSVINIAETVALATEVESVPRQHG